MQELRISVTDRCNFRCRYCMPRGSLSDRFRFLPRDQLLDFDELARVAQIFASLGVRKVRLTGGEPLLRAELPALVRRLAAIPGLSVVLTTNGSLLGRHARELADAGLDRVTVSLDSLDDEVFRRMNDVSFPVASVLEGIDLAAAAGLRPIKVNAVVRRGVNDAGVVDLARYFKGTGHVLRFVELMDVGTTNAWSPDQVVPGAEILARIGAVMPLEPVAASHPGEVAKRYRHRDGDGEIGVVTSVTQPFCGPCNRARLTADGRLYTCLFAKTGTDLRALLRGGADDAAVAAVVRETWSRRMDRYSELRSLGTARPGGAEMSYIGG